MENFIDDSRSASTFSDLSSADSIDSDAEESSEASDSDEEAGNSGPVVAPAHLSSSSAPRTASKAMKRLVAQRESIFVAQRARGERRCSIFSSSSWLMTLAASLQAKCERLVDAQHASMVTSSRYVAISRLLNFRRFCTLHNIPVFPFVGSIIALSRSGSTTAHRSPSAATRARRRLSTWCGS